MLRYRPAGGQVVNRLHHQGVLLIAMRRFREVHLPRAEDMRDRVDRGECLTDADLAYLRQTFGECRAVGWHAADMPDWQEICVRVVALYRSLMERAVENELGRA
jgi:hypothetical protein